MRHMTLGLVLLALLQGCGEPTTPSTPLAVVVDPNPILTAPVPVPCPLGRTCTTYPWGAGWTLSVRANADGRLDKADVAVVRLSTGMPIAVRHYGPAEFIQAQGSDRLAAGGTMTLRQGLEYEMPAEASDWVAVEISVGFTPARGPAVEQSVRVPLVGGLPR